jgi:LPXTG-motif cell wall-anchored protein
LKKLMLLAAMLALVVVAASPAFAQSGSEIAIEESDVTLEDSTTAEDSIVQRCPASVTFADGNANEQELVQSGFSPEVAAECTQEIAQAAAAGGKAEAKAGDAEAKASPAPAAQAQAGGAKAELPKTGGGASLLALGAGALLVGGGLVARRIIK